jgi:preprotein translocase subunit SecE|tara:strand:+ start:615 stop:737 length:123 start_codon:yes stop_codon:yes gene_type:complete
MNNKKKTYKTKEVNIVKLSAFYEQVRKETKKQRNGERNIQ